jgi:hypothetical protein
VDLPTGRLTVGAGTMSRPILERPGVSVDWFDCLCHDLAPVER